MDTFPSSGSQDRYFNCLCIIFNELVSCESREGFLKADKNKRSQLFTDSKIYATKKAYCLMFSNSYYQLQQDVLSTILKSLKSERFRLSKQFAMSTNLHNVNDPILIDILSCLETPIIT